ncbi:MAG: sensor histidine kinase [Actinobacteria bacterium]|nr:sensor histidine kinase [Actinomycetota bacterium]
MRSFIRSLLDEGRASGPPPPGRLDVALIIGLSILGGASFLFEDEVSFRIAAAATAAAGIVALWFRRQHPMWAVVVALVPQILIHTVAYLADRDTPVLASAGLPGLILVYSLLRWASGREIAGAMGVVLVANFVSETAAVEPRWPAAFANLIPWLLAAAVGVVMRYRANLRERDTHEARLEERQKLARELHDTVAHHVSAIAIQAQAGQVILGTDPESVRQALVTIEQTASDTLNEMRRMVGALRSESAATAPQSGLAQVAALVDGWPGGLEVQVTMSGDLEGVADGVESAVYRIAQESVTNAQRHARHATRVLVEVRGDTESISVGVSDDGDSVNVGSSSQGYGLVGMDERARLLGGSLTFGPGPDRGWTVAATLPRET